MISLILAAPLVGFCPASSPALSQDQGFSRQVLDQTFFGEGANFADLDNDGHAEIISGPYIYAGPGFTERRQLYEPKPFDPLHYSDSFFNWSGDIDGDGWTDVVQVGFPGAAAYWYENPGRLGGAWLRHLIHPTVDNESPRFVDITGDETPELVCNSGGAFGYLVAAADAKAPWVFHPITADIGKQRFTHGLGVADVNGDGRADVLERGGWWEQPASLEGDPAWVLHAYSFSGPGGAQMYGYDIDGDGDCDVVTSLHAHGWGLAWFEQVPGADGGVDFKKHVLMGAQRGDNPYGVRFAAVHALAVGDVDGDGLTDVITGKRHWSHGPDGDPIKGLPSVIYWFRLERTESGARFVPHLIDDDSGVGTQVVAGDVNGDGRLDVVVGNKQGTYYFEQSSAGVDVTEPPLHKPVPRKSPNERPGKLPTGSDGKPLNLGFELGDLTHWTPTGEAFADQPVKGMTVLARMGQYADFVGNHWMGGYEIHQDGPTGTLLSDSFEITADWASYLIGGGAQEGTRVDLILENGTVLHTANGTNQEGMKVAVLDLRQHRGKHVRVKLVDEVAGSWGHLNFDDFLFHQSRPGVASGQLALTKDVIEHSGLTPQQAAEAMTVPAGFHVDLVAGEPSLHQPIALAVDGRGRLWVAEAHTYPKRAPEGEGRDKIVVFEDTNADGNFDRQVLFADGLNLVSGLEVGFGGVWIGAAPYLMFIPDENDDLVPDSEPVILLDGWGLEDTHETLNAFTWGPDGWLYGCHGVFTHAKVGAPGTADEDRVPMNAGVWRFHPTRHEFEVFAWGTSNPWGVAFDEHGQTFVTSCVIPHLFHLAQGGRYNRQAGSHFSPYIYEDIVTIADHRHYLGSNPHNGNNRSSQAGGGHAHCGAMIYQGDAFPEEYRGSIFMNNVHGNRMNRDSFVRDGSGFIGKHEDDFLLANDTWFRGINMKTGPNGEVYFIDWSDEQACHHNDVNIWNRTNGRMYRVRYGDLQTGSEDLSQASAGELLALLNHDNSWQARGAASALQQRGGAELQPALEYLVRDGESARKRLRSLWTLHISGGVSDRLTLELLDDPDENLVSWAIQFACEDRLVGSDIADAMLHLASDSPSPRVRLYLASALERMGADLRGSYELCAALLTHAEDEDDPNLSYLYWYGLSKLISADPGRGLILARASELDRPQRLALRQLSADDSGLNALCAELASATGDWANTLLSTLDASLASRRGVTAPKSWAAAYVTLAASPDLNHRERALWIAAAFQDPRAIPELQAIAQDTAATDERRVRALESLEAQAADTTPPLSTVFLSALTAPPLRGVAINALAKHSSAEVPPTLLALYADLDEDSRRAVCATLSARMEYAGALLEALEQGKLPNADVSAFVIRKLRAFEDEALLERVTALFGIDRASSEEKLARIEELKQRFATPNLAHARPANGRAVYDRTCGKCHTLFDAGEDLGPDLTGSNRTDLDYLFTNITDPNAIIGRDYQATLVRTLDGLLVTGLLKQEDGESIVLQSETETSVVALDEIEERVLSTLSIMPEGQLETLSLGEQRDLIAYITSSAQYAAPESITMEESLFDGKSLDGWSGDTDVWRAENGELIGESAGLAKNSFLVSSRELADFRFSCDVLLKDNAGNSGIQFRSRASDDGSVAGYQADIGAGWWGKLYEEHGRALLCDKEADIEEGDWNAYVIEAKGTRIRTWLNGELCFDYDDPEGAVSGVFALQVHSGGATTVRFRNLRLSAPE
ncbi:MAG: putative membrane-bound dehydrogenase-like protein [Planctomycetota bacterium]|jgi:putative membrane-bound dehydrogenase-like protein